MVLDVDGHRKPFEQNEGGRGENGSHTCDY